MAFNDSLFRWYAIDRLGAKYLFGDRDDATAQLLDTTGSGTTGTRNNTDIAIQPETVPGAAEAAFMTLTPEYDRNIAFSDAVFPPKGQVHSGFLAVRGVVYTDFGNDTANAILDTIAPVSNGDQARFIGIRHVSSSFGAAFAYPCLAYGYNGGGSGVDPVPFFTAAQYPASTVQSDGLWHTLCWSITEDGYATTWGDGVLAVENAQYGKPNPANGNLNEPIDFSNPTPRIGYYGSRQNLPGSGDFGLFTTWDRLLSNEDAANLHLLAMNAIGNVPAPDRLDQSTILTQLTDNYNKSEAARQAAVSAESASGTGDTVTELPGTLTSGENTDTVTVSLTEGSVGDHLIDSMVVVTSGTKRGATALIKGTESSDLILNRPLTADAGASMKVVISSSGFYRPGGVASARR